MESADELYKQLKKLSLTINQCNFISLEDKKDIIQDTMVSLFEKFKEGKITDNFDDIKGYSFITLRNKCVAFKMKQKLDYMDDVIEELGNTVEIDLDQEDYNLYLHKLIKQYIQHDKYTYVQKETCRMTLENKELSEISKELNMSNEDISKVKYNIKMRLKVDAKRKRIYLIKNKYDKKIKYPCYTREDIKYFFKGDITERQINSMVYESFVTKDGHYIEKEKIN